jgi:hypothetical protein
MFATFSHKGFPKIHPDAPRNASCLQTAVGWVCRVITLWSPTQLTIHHHHLVFTMLHVTTDSIVQTVSWFMPSVIRNAQMFPGVSAEITDRISPALVLSETQPGWPFSLIWKNLRGNPTRISPYPMKPDLSLTLTWLPNRPRRLTWLLTRPYPMHNPIPNWILIRPSLPPNPSLTRL